MSTAVVEGEIFDYDSELYDGIRSMLDLPSIRKCITAEHTRETPRRVVESFKELFSGCYIDPKSVLKTSFSDDYDEMVFVNSIEFVSVCAHHLLPFHGKAHFAYIPNKTIVGLSKIPRLVEVYSRRPQVQEKLTREIVGTFQEIVKPKGCGLVMEAYHLCMSIRGVKKASAYTRTTKLTGIFMTPEVRAEFLAGTPKPGGLF